MAVIEQGIVSSELELILKDIYLEIYPQRRKKYSLQKLDIVGQFQFVTRSYKQFFKAQLLYVGLVYYTHNIE